MNSTKTRLVLPDVLKGLAVILMIHAHVMEQLVNPAMFESSLGKLATYIAVFPGAAVFMIVMGYFVGYSKKANPITLVKRGIMLFGGGFLLNILLNLSYMIRFVTAGYPELIPTAIFGVDILYLAGLSLIIIGGLKKVSTHPLFWIAVALLIVGITPLINQIIDGCDTGKYFTAFIGGTAKWSYFPLFPWLAYPLTGLAVHALGLHKWKSLPVWVKAGFLGITLVGFLAGLKMGYNVSTTLSIHYHHNIVYYLWTLSFIVLVVYILKLMKIEAHPLRTAFLSFVGKEVTLIYVFQWILIGNIAAWLGKESLFAGHLAWTLSFIMLSVLLAYIYRKLTSRN